MKPIVEIAPLGNVHLNWEFHEGTVNQYTTQNLQDGITTQSKKYTSYFTEQKGVDNTDEADDFFAGEFASAIETELGCSMKSLVDFLGVIHAHLLKQDTPIWDCCTADVQDACANEKFEHMDQLASV